MEVDVELEAERIAMEYAKEMIQRGVDVDDDEILIPERIRDFVLEKQKEDYTMRARRNDGEDVDIFGSYDSRNFKYGKQMMSTLDKNLDSESPRNEKDANASTMRMYNPPSAMNTGRSLQSNFSKLGKKKKGIIQDYEPRLRGDTIDNSEANIFDDGNRLSLPDIMSNRDGSNRASQANSMANLHDDFDSGYKYIPSHSKQRNPS